MIRSKRFIIGASAAGIIGIAGIGATAMAVTNSATGSYPSIVQKIASTFNLDPAKVNDVFQQQHLQNQQDREAKVKSVLDQAVKDGKITQDQEDKLVAELKTLQSQLQSGNETDRHQAMQNLKTQLEQWAKDNGISNLDQILPGPGMGMHHGMMNDNDGDADDSGAASAN